MQWFSFFNGISEPSFPNLPMCTHWRGPAFWYLTDEWAVTALNGSNGRHSCKNTRSTALWQPVQLTLIGISMVIGDCVAWISLQPSVDFLQLCSSFSLPSCVLTSFWPSFWCHLNWPPDLWWQIPAWQHGRHAPELMCVLMAKLLIPVPHTLYTAEARAEDHHEMEANEQKKTKVSVNWFWCPPYHCHHGGGWQDLGYNLSFMPATCGPTCSGTLHTSCGVLHMSSNPQ